MLLDEKKIGSELKYSGILVDVKVDNVELSNGLIAKREVVCHNGGVGILPVDNNGFCYLVKQFRYAADRVMLEIPAGICEENEKPADCALRELSEETGIVCHHIADLGEFFLSPGYLTETLHIFLGTDLQFGTAHPDNNELISMEKIHISELMGKVGRGEITDIKTVLAAMIYSSNMLKDNPG